MWRTNKDETSNCGSPEDHHSWCCVSLLWNSVIIFVSDEFRFLKLLLAFLDQWCPRFNIQLDILCAPHRFGFIFHAQPSSWCAQRVSLPVTLFPTCVPLYLKCVKYLIVFLCLVRSHRYKISFQLSLLLFYQCVTQENSATSEIASNDAHNFRNVDPGKCLQRQCQLIWVG